MKYKIMLINKFVQVELATYTEIDLAVDRLKSITDDLKNKNYKSYCYLVAVTDEPEPSELINNILRLNKDVRKETKKW